MTQLVAEKVLLLDFAQVQNFRHGLGSMAGDRLAQWNFQQNILQNLLRNSQYHSAIRRATEPKIKSV